MIKKNEKVFIGIDHGYGFIKTANSIFKAGIKEIPVEPPIMDDILQYKNSIYVIGQSRNESSVDKTINENYYILTLAALAKELDANNTRKAANVVLCVGLPYSFYSNQKDSFKRYLLKDKHLKFKFENKNYQVDLKDVMIFPQGFASIAEKFNSYEDKYISVVDWGSRTIDVITFENLKAIHEQCFSLDNTGSLDLIDGIRRVYLQKFGVDIKEDTVQKLLMGKKTNIPEENKKMIEKLIKAYIKDCIKTLKNKDISDNIILCGGAGSIIKKHITLSETVTIIDDIFFNAKGYEKLGSNR